ncbi:MAG: DUF5995 family protein [Rubricoccaceae bacterium]|nr:DUF5995 family protein [Rubricoccaceae bacterium]
MEPQIDHPQQTTVAADPAERVAAVAGRFEEYRGRYEVRRDRRAVCLLAFNMMYQELSWKLYNNNFGFDDPDWVADLAVEFAGLLFSSFDQIDQAIELNPNSPDFSHIPRPWVDVHLAINDDRSSVLEDLLCGLIAHIGHDLPLALSMVGLESNGTSRVRDFHRLNEVLGSLTDVVQTAITRRFNRLLNILDRLAGHTDEKITDMTMHVSRAVAWYTAERLLDPASSEEVYESMETVVVRTMGRMRPRTYHSKFVLWSTRTIVKGKRRWPRRFKDWRESRRTS